MKVASLHRYPVKGFSPEAMAGLDLSVGDYVPADRLYAVENGPSGFDLAAPQHQPKIKFLMLMRNEALVRLRTRYLDETATLVVEIDGHEALRSDLGTDAGRLAFEAFLRRQVPKELRGPPKVLTAPPGFRFTDSRRGFVSILNLASVRAIEGLVGRPVDLLRFRANVAVEGLEPWAEFDLVGREINAPSGLVLAVTKRIVRCAATNVDPVTGERDLEIPRTLAGALGHMDCGIYAEIRSSGRLNAGDLLEVAPARQPELPF
ncbi:MOSC domain-containing protein [uncultured Enterovirga sp.]|uniref:MOSC domain-containing protein n=1 Tax=uncultured Enterovirga sp. TaxID=2026352 RepID=UPI0035C9CED1